MAKNKVSYKKTFLAGIITENPVFVSLLGMCPTLATTKSIEAALGIDAEPLLSLQTDYNLHKMRKDRSFMEKLAQLRKSAAML